VRVFLPLFLTALLPCGAAIKTGKVLTLPNVTGALSGAASLFSIHADWPKIKHGARKASGKVKAAARKVAGK